MDVAAENKVTALHGGGANLLVKCSRINSSEGGFAGKVVRGAELEDGIEHGLVIEEFEAAAVSGSWRFGGDGAGLVEGSEHIG